MISLVRLQPIKMGPETEAQQQQHPPITRIAFFADFAEMSTSTSVNSTNSNSSNENQPQKQQTMSKDSIMALFNQRPTAAPASNPMFATTSQPQGFVQHGQGGGGVVGGMQIPASFGLGVGLQ